MSMEPKFEEPEAATDQPSSLWIRIELDGKPLSRHKWDHSGRVAALRSFLEQKYPDNMLSAVEFVDGDAYPFHRNDEEELRTSEIICGNAGLIKLRTIQQPANLKQTTEIHDEKSNVNTDLKDEKSTPVEKKTRENIEVPMTRSKALEKQDASTYLSAPSRSHAAPLNPIILPGSQGVHSTTNITLATQLTLDVWKELFANCTLLHGIRMDDIRPKLASVSMFRFNESNKCLPRFLVNDKSYTGVYVTDKQLESAFVSNKFFDGGPNISCPFIGIGINGEYSKSKAQTKEKRTVYQTSCYNYPRVEVHLDLSYLELTQEFVDAVNSVLVQQPDQQLIKLKQVLSRFGHVYPDSAVLGGHLYHTEERDITGVADEEKKGKASETHSSMSFTTRVPVSVSVSAGARHDENSRTVSSQQDSQATFEAVGGNTLISRDPTQWANTVANPTLWRVIEYKDFQSVIKLLSPEQQQAIQKIIDATKESSEKQAAGAAEPSEKADSKIDPQPTPQSSYLNVQWEQEGVTIAGGNGRGGNCNQLDYPMGIFVTDDDQTTLVADYYNHRIMEWKKGDTKGKVVAGERGKGNRLDQLNYPNRVLIDKKTDSIIISDRYNRRVVQWSRNSGTTHGEILIENIYCSGLALDEQGYLYVSETEKQEVRRYQINKEDKEGTVVAGGHGAGNGLNQLNNPYYIFVDQQQNIYVSDYENYRVMKWNKDATEGIVVAGGQGYGYALTQLAYPTGIFVDTLGTLYVAERVSWRGFGYNRVTRWPQGKKQGTIIVGTNDKGARANQFDRPEDLTFDRHGNLYVVDSNNHRVQRFSRV